MHKRTAFLAFLFTIGISASAQSTRAYVGLGASYQSFQDARFTDLQITGTGPILELGFRNVSETSYILAHVNGFVYSTDQPNAGENRVSSLGFNVRGAYMHNLAPGFYLGATWNLLDYSTRTTEGLDNGDNFFHIASDLLASARYVYTLNKNWSFEFGGDLGLLTFSKYAPSFTANLLQSAIDEGRASFQDISARMPFDFKNIDTKPIWKQVYIRTHVEVFFRRRLSAAYSWDMRSFSDQKGYPLTQAAHNLTLRFHFISTPK